MKNILIIDDDKRIRDIVKIQLNNKGFELHEAKNDSEAFTILGAIGIDLILCDVKMKELDGISLLKQIKEGEHKNIPVIMLTGFIDQETSIKAKKAGCFDLITKPVKRRKLLETIESAL